MSVEDTVRRVAAELGVDPDLAIATARQESGLDPNAIGDSGCSFGVFQLNRCGGEGTGMSEAQLFDVETNARRALSEFAHVMQVNPELEGGALAAAAQRPADPAGYAVKVDALLASIRGAAAQVIAPITGPVGPVGPQGPAAPVFQMTDELRRKIRAWLDRNAAFGAKDPAGTADRLRKAFPDVPLADLRSVVGDAAHDADPSTAPVLGGIVAALEAAGAAAKNVTDAAGSAAAAAKSISDQLAPITSTLSSSSTWWRAAFIVVGAVMIVAGTRLYLGSTSMRKVEATA